MIGALERAYGRVLMALGLGRVTVTQDAGPTQLLQVRMDAAEVRDNTPSLGHYGFASRPKPGADAVVVFLGGNRGSGIVIATADRRYRLLLQEGEVALHTDEGDAVHLKRGRVVEITAGTKLRIVSPLVEVTGDVTAGGVSLREHLHGGVQPGGGTSGIPVGGGA